MTAPRDKIIKGRAMTPDTHEEPENLRPALTCVLKRAPALLVIAHP
jgi:hypothetical protein